MILSIIFGLGSFGKSVFLYHYSMDQSPYNWMRKYLVFISIGFVHMKFPPFSLIVVDSAE